MKVGAIDPSAEVQIRPVAYRQSVMCRGQSRQLDRNFGHVHLPELIAGDARKKPRARSARRRKPQAPRNVDPLLVSKRHIMRPAARAPAPPGPGRDVKRSIDGAKRDVQHGPVWRRSAIGALQRSLHANLPCDGRGQQEQGRVEQQRDAFDRAPREARGVPAIHEPDPKGRMPDQGQRDNRNRQCQHAERRAGEVNQREQAIIKPRPNEAQAIPRLPRDSPVGGRNVLTSPGQAIRVLIHWRGITAARSEPVPYSTAS